MNHLCLGCGICAALCPQGSIQMEFSPVQGFFLPSGSMDQCETACGLCERVCPFVPENSDTAEISRGLFGSSEGIRHDDVLGYFHGTFAGYSEEHRMTSASGGLVVRRQVERYGFAHKLASVRNFGFSSTYVNGFLKKYKKEDRAKAPETKKIIDAIFHMPSLLLIHSLTFFIEIRQNVLEI